MKLILFYFLLFLALTTTAQTKATNVKTYEYIVVGSGPGGGTLAARLARAGHTVLLIEAGSDQSLNTNASVTSNAPLADDDPKMVWDFFVRHTDNKTLDDEFEHTVWRQTDNQFYVGLNPPAGATKLGIWYPRSATLGGCAMHNAAYFLLPSDEYWNDIMQLTGDKSWGSDGMRKYLVKLERNNYLPNGSTPTHGFDGWLETSQDSPSWAVNASDEKTIAQMATAKAGGNPTKLTEYLLRDMNAVDPKRDQEIGIFGHTTHDKGGLRSSPAYFIRDTLADPKNYPLTLQLNTLATKILFDTNKGEPKAIGIEYLQGESLYGGDRRYNSAKSGTPGQVFASREVIIAGGVFNSPQLLKLSGIGPAAELKKFKIPIVKDLPGVGENLDDNYEGTILGKFEKPTINGFAEITMFWKSSKARNRDILYLCAPFAFEGFWPGYGEGPPTPTIFDCPFVVIQPKHIKGRVLLVSTNPRDVPTINNGFWSKGPDDDLDAMHEAVEFFRGIFNNVTGNAFTELSPCSNTTSCTVEKQKKTLRSQAWSHHATSTCAIGADNDPLAVLDSKLRVRGVKNLRVVDGSAFPKVPGAFPVAATFMLGEKVAAEIIADAK